jgi:protein-tyrosine-phosphatase
MVDDHPRLAYSEVLADENGVTCAGFILRAADYFADHGISTIERVLTDNHFSYRRSHQVKAAIAALGATQKFIRPHCPRQNGCIHNAGRSQMAAAYTRHLSGGAVDVLSAGSEPADQVNPSAVAAMAEDGIYITAETPKILTSDAVKASDVVITMGCGDTCPIFPGKRYEDWVLEDPAGKGVESVRPIRDEIKARVLALLDELGVAPVRV